MRTRDDQRIALCAYAPMLVCSTSSSRIVRNLRRVSVMEADGTDRQLQRHIEPRVAVHADVRARHRGETGQTKRDVVRAVVERHFVKTVAIGDRHRAAYFDAHSRQRIADRVGDAAAQRGGVHRHRDEQANEDAQHASGCTRRRATRSYGWRRRCANPRA